MRPKPKIALVGSGKWGKKLLSELALQADLQTVVTKGSSGTISFLKENYPLIKVSQNLDEILDNPEITAVAVATPTRTHFEISKKVIASGKHLFLEKPGANDSNELSKINEAAKQNNLIFAVGYEFIHHPVLQKIMEKIEPKDIEYINMEWFKWGTFNDPAPAHLLSHEVSILKHLTGTDIVVSDLKQSGVISKSDIVYCNMKVGRFHADSIINRVSPEKRKTVTVKSVHASYIWNNNDLLIVKEEKLEKVEISSDSPVKRELMDFFDSVQNGTKPKADGDFAVQVLKTIEKPL